MFLSMILKGLKWLLKVFTRGSNNTFVTSCSVLDVDNAYTANKRVQTKLSVADRVMGNVQNCGPLVLTGLEPLKMLSTQN